MNLIDIVILVVMIPLVIHGLSKGFISQAVTLAALLFGSWIAYRLTLHIGPDVAEALGISVSSGNIIVFAAALLAIWALLSVVGHVLRQILNLVLLEWVDHLLGGVFAIGTALLLCGLGAILFDALNEATFLFDRQYLEESFFYGKVQRLAAIAFPYLHQIIPSARDYLLNSVPLPA